MTYKIRDNFHWKFIKRNIIDFAEGFLPVTLPKPNNKEGKRILIFNWRDTKHTFAGGAEVYIHELAKKWVEKGHQVTLFCGNDSKSKRNEVIDGVYIVRRGGFYFVYIWAFLYYLIHFRRKYDVIIDAQNGIPFFTPLYAKEPIFSLLFHVHQEVFRTSLIKPLAQVATFLEKNCMPFLYRNTPFLTISESTQKEITRLGLGYKGASIIYPGVTLQNLESRQKSLEPLVLYMGRLKYYKRVDVLLRSTKEILSKNNNVKFIIAGDGEHKNNLKKLSKRLGIENKVTFLGRVSEKEKASLYSKAWVVVNPSMMEGWGITTIEANAHGTAVVASDVPGLQDSVKNGYNGFLFPVGNETELAKILLSIIKNQRLRMKMEKNALKWAQKFDWNKSAEIGLQTILQPPKVKSISIGVPAFNEEGNIKTLLYSLLAQEERGFYLKEIVVISDGSEDNTVKKVKEIQDRRIRIIHDAKRVGKSARLNQLLSTLKADITLLVDADIEIRNPKLLADILKDSDISRTGIVAVKASPLPGRNFFERCINHSVHLQNHLRSRWSRGNNYLAFRGCFMLLHHEVTKKIRLNESIYNNDAYVYFLVKNMGFLPRYIPSLNIFYRSPNNFSDHMKQSSRFQSSAKELQPFFTSDLQPEYEIPKLLFIWAVAINFIKNPIYFVGFIVIFLRAKYAKTQNLKSTWNIALSTKTA